MTGCLGIWFFPVRENGIFGEVDDFGQVGVVWGGWPEICGAPARSTA